MKEKFDYILLPPDAFHLNLEDTLSSSRVWFNEIFNAIHRIKRSNQNFLVKYRSELQKKHFPVCGDSIVGYGVFVNYCHKKTVVIGPPGSACVESLLNNVEYYVYDRAQVFGSSNQNKASFNRLTEVLYTARNTQELVTNINNKQIYKANHSKKDILYRDGLYLHEIVNIILSNE